MGHKEPWCIGTGMARTQITFNSIHFNSEVINDGFAGLNLNNI